MISKANIPVSMGNRIPAANNLYKSDTRITEKPLVLLQAALYYFFLFLYRGFRGCLYISAFVKL